MDAVRAARSLCFRHECGLEPTGRARRRRRKPSDKTSDRDFGLRIGYKRESNPTGNLLPALLYKRSRVSRVCAISPRGGMAAVLPCT